MALDDIFEKFDAQLTTGMRAKLGDRFTSLADCYAAKGGVFDDPILLRQRRLAVYAYGEFDGVGFGVAADIAASEAEVAPTKDSLLAIVAMFDKKYKNEVAA